MILGLVRTLPARFSLRFFLPLAAINSFTLPGAVALLPIFFRPRPDTVSLPGLGTMAVRITVPLRTLRLALPRASVFDGENTAEMLSRLWEGTGVKAAASPSARFPTRNRYESPGAENPHATLPHRCR